MGWEASAGVEFVICDGADAHTTTIFLEALSFLYFFYFFLLLIFFVLFFLH